MSSIPNPPSGAEERRWFKKKRFLIPGILVLLFAIGGAMGGADETTDTAAQPPDDNGSTSTSITTTTAKPDNDSKGISLEEFEQLETGMSYAQAVEIIGTDGTVQSENELAGTRTVMYAFDGEQGLGANALVMFQNDKLNTKSQFGLR